jgi:type I restriction enzyme, S subunit
MKPYPLYKPTNIEWIGEIPKHWEIILLRRITNEHRQGYYIQGDYLLNGVKLVRITDLSDDGIISYENMPYVNISENDELIFQIKEGDFLFPRTGSIGLIGVVKNPERAVFASYLINFRFTSRVNNDFLKYIFFSYPFKCGINRDLHGGVNQNIHAENIKNQFVSLPSESEQTAIANYLDEKTALIDTLIADKKKLIELLKEERIAVINEAVCGEGKGWERKKLKYLVSDKLMYGANEQAELEEIKYPRYIRITDFGDDGMLRDDTFKSLPLEIAEKYLLKEGDILFARSGATVGKTFQFKNYQGQACFAGYLIKATPDPKQVLSDYLYYYTKSGYYENWRNSIFIQATIQNIGADKYNTLEIPLPSIDDQRLIVKDVDAANQKINSSILKINREIELLQEYRIALISEVVTGKVDVRNKV